MAMQEASRSSGTKPSATEPMIGDTFVNLPGSHHVHDRRQPWEYWQTRIRHNLKIEMCHTAWFLISYLLTAINMQSKGIIFLINSHDSIQKDLLIQRNMTVSMLGVLPGVDVQVKQKPNNKLKEEEPFQQEAPGLNDRQTAWKESVASSSCIDSSVHTTPSMEPLLSVIQRHQVLQRTASPCTRIRVRVRR
jgi:hypothetical protein